MQRDSQEVFESIFGNFKREDKRNRHLTLRWPIYAMHKQQFQCINIELKTLI